MPLPRSTGPVGGPRPDPAQAGVPVQRHQLDVAFDAFSVYHVTLWRRYAHTQVGGDAADGVVDAACRRLRANWDHVLAQDSVARYAWRVLKEEVHQWLSERELEPAFVGTAAFQAAAEKLLPYGTPDRFALLQREMGLYAAIAGLPERQYDVVVLLYVLKVPEADVAEYLGLDEATVRSHTRHARRRISRALNPPERGR